MSLLWSWHMTQNVLVQFYTLQQLAGDKRIGCGVACVDISERNKCNFIDSVNTHLNKVDFWVSLTCLPEPFELFFWGKKLATCYWFSFCQMISTNNLIICNFRSLSSSSCSANPGFMGDRGKGSSTTSKWCMWPSPFGLFYVLFSR